MFSVFSISRGSILLGSMATVKSPSCCLEKNSTPEEGQSCFIGEVFILFRQKFFPGVKCNYWLLMVFWGLNRTPMIVIAIFRTYEEIKREGAIFAIEEPEVFLHPQKQRYFSTILEGLGAKNQIFITTHSPVFVKLYSPEEVCLIRRNKTDGTMATICEKDKIIKSEKEALKIQNYFDNQRNELFFAKGVVLVEGATEKFAFPYASRKKSIDLDRFGISV